ncbi:MAG: lysylphosphatidylglycerol synthase transmembrane domain-containing protein [Edaphocola sp.]
MAEKKSSTKTLLQLIVFLGIGLGLILWQYNGMSDTDKQQMFASMRQARLVYVLPVFVISFFSHFFRALRWQLLLQPLHIRTRITNVTLAVLIGYLVNLLVPRAGEVAKCTILAKYEKVPADKMVGTIVAERAFDLVCLMAITFVTLGLQYSVIYGYAAGLGAQLLHKFFTDAQGQLMVSRLLMAGGGLLLLAIAFVVLLRRSRKTKVGGILAGIAEGLKAITKVKRPGLFFIYTILIWACYTLVLNVGFFAMDETMRVAPLASLSIIVFGSVAMIVTPGGIGAYPPVVASILTLYGVTFAAGSAFGWLAWLAQTVIIVVLGLISLIVLPIYNNANHHTPTPDRT